MVIKTIVKKSSNKVYIIQSLDKKLSIEDIAKAKGLTSDELIKEIETIVESGTKLDLQYMLDDIRALASDIQHGLVDLDIEFSKTENTHGIPRT